MEGTMMQISLSASVPLGMQSQAIVGSLSIEVPVSGLLSNIKMYDNNYVTGEIHSKFKQTKS